MRLAGETYSNGGKEITEVAKYGESLCVRWGCVGWGKKKVRWVSRLGVKVKG